MGKKGGKGQKTGVRSKYVQFAPETTAPTTSARGSLQPRVPTTKQPPTQGTPASSSCGRAGDSAERCSSSSTAGHHLRDAQHLHDTSGAHSPNGRHGNIALSSPAADGSSTPTTARHDAQPSAGASHRTSNALPIAPTPTLPASASSSPHTGGTPATALAGAVNTAPHRPRTPGGAQASLGTSKNAINLTTLITQPPVIPAGLTPALTGHVVKHIGKATDNGFIVVVYSPALRRHFAYRGRLPWSPRSGCGVHFKPTGDTIKVHGVKLLATERLTPRRKLDPAPSEWVSTTLQRSGNNLRLEMAFPPLADDSRPHQTHLELEVTQGGQPPYPSGTPLRVQVGVTPSGAHCLLGAQLDLAALRRKVPTQLHPDELTHLGPDVLVLGGLGERDARLGSRHLPLGNILTHPIRTLDEWDMTKALLDLASANDLPRTPAAPSSSPEGPPTAQPVSAEGVPPRPIVVVVVAEGGKNYLREWHRRINLWFDGSCRDGLTRAPLSIRQRFQFHLIAPVEARVTPTTAQAFLPLEFMHDTSGAWNYARRLRLQDHLVASFRTAPDRPSSTPRRQEGPAPPTYVQTGQDMRLSVLDYTWEKAEPIDCGVSIPTSLHQSCAFVTDLVPRNPSTSGQMEDEPEPAGADDVIDIALPPAQGVIVEFAQKETTVSILEGILKHAAAGAAAGVHVSNIHSFRGSDHGAIIQGPPGFDFAGLAQYLNGRAAQPTFNAMPLSNFFAKSAIDLWLGDRAAVSTALLRRLFGPKATFYQNGPHAVRVYLPADHRMRQRETLVEGLSTFNKKVGDSATPGATSQQGAPGQRSRQRPSQPFIKSFTLGGRITWLLRERPRPRRQWGSPEAAERAADPTLPSDSSSGWTAVCPAPR